MRFALPGTGKFGSGLEPNSKYKPFWLKSIVGWHPHVSLNVAVAASVNGYIRGLSGLDRPRRRS